MLAQKNLFWHFYPKDKKVYLDAVRAYIRDNMAFTSTWAQVD